MKYFLLLTLLWIAGYNKTSGQRKLSGTFYTYCQMGGLCSTVLHFMNDSLFSSNQGCEGPGHTHYGRYKIRADSLLLEHGLIDTSLRIVTIDSLRKIGSNQIVLRFIDQNGQNISRRFKAHFFRDKGRRYGFSYDSTLNALTATNLEVQKISITSLKLMGIEADLQSDFKTGIELTYHLHIPPLIFDYINKDIAQRGLEVLLIRPDRLIPVNDEVTYVSEEPRIFYKDTIYSKQN
ncbi:hypothetical protein [Taibaiella koreensis]|uniref:hypothetical protein n=1 Tax=Taibaiella koreensis TaxID=1268548 RepID=UPI0013C30A31|nr:hypothetical protein [Taibaiella koreensis]